MKKHKYGFKNLKFNTQLFFGSCLASLFIGSCTNFCPGTIIPSCSHSLKINIKRPLSEIEKLEITESANGGVLYSCDSQTRCLELQMEELEISLGKASSYGVEVTVVNIQVSENHVEFIEKLQVSVVSKGKTYNKTFEPEFSSTLTKGQGCTVDTICKNATVQYNLD